MHLRRAFVLHLCAFAILVASLAPAAAQAPTDVVSRLQSLPAAAQSLPLRRFEYFYMQRAYPNQQIPPGAMERARPQHEQQFGPLRQQPAPGVPPPFSQNQWTSIGPSHIASTPTASGRINSIAIDPTNTSIIYIGAATGGVWKTTDGGTTWSALTDTQCSLAMGSIAIDPNNHLIIYAGTGEANFSADSYSGCGVLKSTDGGVTWTQMGASVFAPSGAAGATIAKVAIDPRAGTLFVASSFGVYRSTNGGSTFTQVLAGTATDFVINSSTNPSTIYAALGNVNGDAANGIYQSVNGGATWTQQTNGVPSGASVGRIALAIAPTLTSTLYAAIQDPSASTFGQLLGFFQTVNGGGSWASVAAAGFNPCDTQCWYDLVVAVDALNPNTVYVGGVSLWVSVNGGVNFSDIGSPIHVDQHAIVFPPGCSASPCPYYAGNDGGLFFSTANPILSPTFSSLNTNLAITQFYPGLALHPTSVNTALGGTQDNHVLQYSGPSTVWTPEAFTGVSACDGGFTAIDFTTPTTGYAECQWSPSSGFSGPRKSTNIGVNAFNLATSGITLSDQAQFIAPLVMSPSTSSTLYFGTGVVYKTTNGAGSWSAISPDLTGGGCATSSFNCISSIAEAKSNGQVIYVGTGNGKLQVTVNGGSNWTQMTTGLPNRAITRVAVDPSNANNAFVTVSGFGTGHVFKTTNGGTSWTDISGNLPNIPANSIVLDPAAPTAEILVGTDLGVYRTHNGGTSWTPFNYGIPNVPVLDLVFNSGTGVLAAASHGRGVWTASLGALTVTHDFNGDRKSDILWRNSGGGVALWMTSGATVLASLGVGSATPDWSVVGQRDFDNDGFADILWRDSNGGVALWLMNGATVKSAVGVGGVTIDWSIVGTGDYNGDGFPDILWYHTSGHVALWLMNGATIVSALAVGSVPTNWQIVGSGDFNGDGKSDILWRDTTGGGVAIWLMNGATVTSAVGVGNLPMNWVVAGTGDFNADVKADILWRETNSGGVVLWLMNPNGTILSAVGVGSVTTDWSIVETGDFNGDGTSDILWHNSGGGVALWLMNSATIVSALGVGAVTTDWQIQGANAD